MESYCNRNVSDGRNYQTPSERNSGSSMNCMRDDSVSNCGSQMGICNRTMPSRDRMMQNQGGMMQNQGRTMQSQNRMMQQCRREEKMTQQCRRTEQMEHCRREERMENQHEKEDRNHNRNVRVDCVCQVSSEKDSHRCDEKNCRRHDDMEKLGCDFPLVMAYVPWQQWGDMYDAEYGLKQGTVFKDLNYIFCGERC